MVQRFHGIDRHKRSSTISVLNREGVEVAFIASCASFSTYIEKLGAEDAVVMEVGMGSFWWADKIESKGASCYVIDPYRFRIIKDSWKKTDKHDSRTMAKALWVQTVSGEFGLPVVWKPTVLIRELRKLFAQYMDLNVHICMLKNRVQSLAVENGITLTLMQKKELLSPRTGAETLGKLELSDASRLAVRMNQEILWGVVKQKELLAQEILRMGSPLAKEVKLLLTIKGVTFLTALAFLADVGDVRRFRTLRKMNAYLGLVPRLRESGQKSHAGHINRASRSLTRTLLTQSVNKALEGSAALRRFYEQVRERSGTGRARIAVIRKLCGVMRQMLLKGEGFRETKEELYAKKLRLYERRLEELKGEQKSA